MHIWPSVADRYGQLSLKPVITFCFRFFNRPIFFGDYSGSCPVPDWSSKEILWGLLVQDFLLAGSPSCHSTSSPETNRTRMMYWRRASIQAHGDVTVLKRFFRDNFVSFRRRSKTIAFWNQWIFLRVSVCKFSIFGMVTWPLFGTLQSPISAKCLVTDFPDKQKAHLQSLGFPSVPLVWGKTVSYRLCAG